jgi:molybdenum cofactor cytidylyltransferase
MTHGIVLAGGASSRMGQPKALLRLGSETFAERLVSLFALRCERVSVVTGAHHAEILAALPQLKERVVFNAQHEQGMFSSLRCGLEAAAGAESVLFSPVDFAAVGAGSVACLFERSGASVVKPRWRGKSGHPVLIGRDAIDVLREAPEVDDEAVAQDCDTPEDYLKLVRLFEARG